MPAPVLHWRVVSMQSPQLQEAAQQCDHEAEVDQNNDRICHFTTEQRREPDVQLRTQLHIYHLTLLCGRLLVMLPQLRSCQTYSCHLHNLQVARLLMCGCLALLLPS
jgi:hypothetical protein